MNYLNMTVEDFINSVDSNAPVPGGGSVSGLTSSLGIALTRMMGSLAIDKKKYKELDETIKNKFLDDYKKLLDIRKIMDGLINEDTKAFTMLMGAYKLPKESVEDINIRDIEILKTTLKATEIPYQIAEHSLDAMKLLPFFAKYGNFNAITDLGVGVMLLYTGVIGALLNVKINLKSLKDENRVETYRKNSAMIEKESLDLKNIIMKIVNEKVM